MPRLRNESDVEEALRNLIHAIDNVHWSPQYQAVWAYACMHGLDYQGPSYCAELDEARALLSWRLQ